jgi:periplasmic mercuric ion binding protein
MKRFAILVLGALLPGLPAIAPVAFAQTAPAAASALTEITFDVPDMSCGLCPLTVEAAMGAVAGVQSVDADLDSLSAVVIFDPTLTDAAAIAEASAQAGYPAFERG